MPTPFEQTPIGQRETQPADWSARSAHPRRSVFGNYRAEPSVGMRPSGGVVQASSTGGTSSPTEPAISSQLQPAIDLAVARAFIYRFLAKAYEDPASDTWHWLTDLQTGTSLRVAAAVCESPVSKSAQALIDLLQPEAFELFLSGYLAAFGHAARGRCPLNEIEYGDIKADPLFQPHRLADLAAFYRAFGLEVAEDADERQDHICLELEFMCVLAAKEGYALEYQLEADELAICRGAQRKFLREHLGRWTPAFARRLAPMAGATVLGALARFTGDFVQRECERFDVAAGSEDLLLRPVDAAAETMCSSCGVTSLLPGVGGAEAEL